MKVYQYTCVLWDSPAEYFFNMGDRALSHRTGKVVYEKPGVTDTLIGEFYA